MSVFPLQLFMKEKFSFTQILSTHNYYKKISFDFEDLITSFTQNRVLKQNNLKKELIQGMGDIHEPCYP